MDTAPLRTARSTYDIYREHLNTVYRVAFTYMKNPFDAEDAAQETFARLIRSGQCFRTPEKEKAWLIVTVSNICKDMLRRHYRSDRSLEDYEHLAAPAHEIDQTMEAILALPEKYRTVLGLYYYEELSTKEIAALLNIRQTAVTTRLARGRELLKQRLTEVWNDE